jgi:predicted dehydrogenase
MMRPVLKFFDGIGTLPHRSSWQWGKRPSVLVFLIGHFFFILRCISPLQYLKSLHRNYRVRHRGLPAITEARRDFHALYTESYFATIFLILIFGYLYSSGYLESAVGLLFVNFHLPIISVNPWIKTISYLLLWAFVVESFTWIAYYLLWRNFSEVRFTLYHPAEYFVIFPLAIVNQVLALALLLGESPFEIMYKMVVGNNLSFRILGLFYFTVALANLRSMLPSTKFKSQMTFNIIGAGDVAANRIVPALLSKMPPQKVQIYTICETDSKLNELKRLDVNVTVCTDQDAIIKSIAQRGGFVIIATPSHAHLSYMCKLHAMGFRYAVEKPVSSVAQEISLLRENISVFQSNLFALSYYGLEKALPVSYLLQGNPHFVRFLEFPDDAKKLSSVEDVLYLFNSLGNLRELRIDLIEDQERSGNRRWTERGNGIAYETFIHPLILARKFLGSVGLKLEDLNCTWTTGSSHDAEIKHSITYLGLHGVAPLGDAQVKVELRAVKYACADVIRRKGVALYQHGRIEFDFDAMNAEITGPEDCRVKIGVKETLKKRYHVQRELMFEFFANGWKDVRYDDFEDQLDVLTWLEKNLPSTHRKYDFQYGLQGPEGEGCDSLKKYLM